MMPDQIEGRNDGPTASKPVTAFLCLSTFALGYLFSLWFLDAYSGGDQEFYTNFWHAMMFALPSQWARLQFQYLGSAEPLYRLIIGVGTYFEFDRIRYLSCWNGILLSTIAYILLKLRSSVLFSFFVFTNYYVIVLLGPAERLKFAYLFFILAFAGGGIKQKGIFSLMSIFAHTQAAVQLLSAAMYYVIDSRETIFSSRWKSIYFAITVPAIFGAAIYLLLNSAGEVISQKAEFYGEVSQGILEIVQWVLILLCGLIVFNKRIQFFIGMLPMGVLTALYGNRINVATLAFFCALALSQDKTKHPLVLAVMGYMSFKSIGFIIDVINTGQGF